MSKTCTRTGCTAKYDDAENHETACQHHDGQPIFHEGLKGWTCCKKRVIDFSEFMSIPGCKWSKHSDEERAPLKPVETSGGGGVGGVSATVAATSADGTERYTSGSKAEADAAAIARARKRDVAAAAAPPPDPLEEPDPADAVIAVGAPCLHRGCAATYVDASSRSAECVYHPGNVTFHDTSKGWTCCRKKVLEFEEVFKIEGCKEGVHRFVEPPPPPAPTDAESGAPLRDCRHDFYQSAPRVTLTVFAKKTDKTKTSVTFPDAATVRVNVVFADGAVYKRDFLLLHEIVPEQCKFSVLTTKIEVQLVKADGGGQWERLER